MSATSDVKVGDGPQMHPQVGATSRSSKGPRGPAGSPQPTLDAWDFVRSLQISQGLQQQTRPRHSLRRESGSSASTELGFFPPPVGDLDVSVSPALQGSTGAPIVSRADARVAELEVSSIPQPQPLELHDKSCAEASPTPQPAPAPRFVLANVLTSSLVGGVVASAAVALGACVGLPILSDFAVAVGSANVFFLAACAMLVLLPHGIDLEPTLGPPADRIQRLVAMLRHGTGGVRRAVSASVDATRKGWSHASAYPRLSVFGVYAGLWTCSHAATVFHVAGLLVPPLHVLLGAQARVAP